MTKLGALSLVIFAAACAPAAGARIPTLHSRAFAPGVVQNTDGRNWVELAATQHAGFPGLFNLTTQQTTTAPAGCSPVPPYRLVGPDTLLNACGDGVTRVTNLLTGASTPVPGQGDVFELKTYCYTAAIGAAGIEKICTGQSRLFYLRSAPDVRVSVATGSTRAIDLDSTTLTTPMCSPLRIGPAFADGWAILGAGPGLSRTSQYLAPYGLKAAHGVALYRCGSTHRRVLCASACTGGVLLPGLVVYGRAGQDYVYAIKTRRTYRLAAPASYLTKHEAFINYAGAATRVIDLPR